MAKYPELISLFNVYKAGNRLIGIAGEVTLPDLSAITTTIEGAGILGKYDSAAVGHYDNMEIEIPFNMLYDDVFSILDPTIDQGLTLRGSVQTKDSNSGAIDSIGMRIVIRGSVKDFKPGKFKQQEQMGASVSYNLSYIMIEMDGENKLELDKLNGIFKLEGKDIMEKIRRYC